MFNELNKCRHPNLTTISQVEMVLRTSRTSQLSRSDLDSVAQSGGKHLRRYVRSSRKLTLLRHRRYGAPLLIGKRLKARGRGGGLSRSGGTHFAVPGGLGNTLPADAFWHTNRLAA
jgi:hypothetical protein